MKRTFAITFAIVLVLGLAGLAGCAPAPMGSADEEDMGVWGYVTSEKSAQLEVTEDQTGVDVLVVDRVLTPEDSWLVVHLDDNGKPGMRIGLLWVAEGETLSAEVPLEGVSTDKVIVAVHADRGTPETFDFEMETATTSPDRPFFVNGAELAKVVTVR